MTRLGRRSLLAGGLGLAVTACTPRSAQIAQRGAHTPTEAPTANPSAKTKRTTIEELLASPAFVVAHRGSGDVWPEHTLTAYLSSLKAGAQAIEISVRAIAGGELVCFHDSDTQRVTGVPGPIAELSPMQLDSRPVDARRWLGPHAPIEPIPRLSEVLDRLPNDSLAFVEDKDGTNTAQLLDLLDQQPNAQQRFIWKQWAPAQQIKLVRQRGYAAWGFFTSDVVHRMADLAEDFDALGVESGSDDDVVRRAVDTGKPIIVWPVHTRSQAKRLRSLGVTGLMCSNVTYVTSDETASRSDQFESGVRAPGDLPTDPEQQWQKQPRIDADSASITLGSGSAPSYLLGSMCPIVGNSYEIKFRLRWRSGSNVTAGLAFCLADDAPFVPGTAQRSSGYQLAIKLGGEVELTDLTDQGTRIAGVAESLSPNGWNEFRVSITPSAVEVSSGANPIGSLRSEAHRGGYVWLWTQSVSLPGVEFAAIGVS